MSKDDHHFEVRIAEVAGQGLLVPEARIASFLPPPKPAGWQTASTAPGRLYSATPGQTVTNPANWSAVVGSDLKLALSVTAFRPPTGEIKKCWQPLGHYGLSVNVESSVTRVIDASYEQHTGTAHVRLLDRHDWGCLQVRCGVDRLTYSHTQFSYGDILTVFVFRDADALKSGLFPPMVTIANLADQNYAPLVPGQLLQLVTSPGAIVEDMQTPNDRCLMFRDQSRPGRSGGFTCHRYECHRVPAVHQHLYVAGTDSAGVILPTIHRNGKDTFVYVTQPYRRTYVACDNLTSLRVRFVKDIPRMKLPTNYLDVPVVNTQLQEITLRFVRPLRSLLIQSEKGQVTFKPTGK